MKPLRTFRRGSWRNRKSAYSASKFAVRGFSNALMQELKGSSVGVTVVHPGGVATAIAERARMPKAATPGGDRRGLRAGEETAQTRPRDRGRDDRQGSRAPPATRPRRRRRHGYRRHRAARSGLQHGHSDEDLRGVMTTLGFALLAALLAIGGLAGL